MNQIMSPEQMKKWMKRAAVFGIALGLLCNALPEKYQTICSAVAHLCTGAMTP